MLYKSTRSDNVFISSSQAIIRGISEDGGLYVPETIPTIDVPLKTLINMNYKDLAFFIMSKFFTDFSREELEECIAKAYDEKFSTPLIAPIVKTQGVYFLELFHGPTLAFKDMALSILPHLLKTAVKKQGIHKDIVILTATSGDTGKAALEGFANVQGIKIIVFFPDDGVSEIQKLQMITQVGDNVLVAGIKGNFDHAQSGVKQIFNDKAFTSLLNQEGYIFSSANSINIGRLVPQIVYYFYAYISLLKSEFIKSGEAINITVPTGNFGNILAAFYAKKMGLPIDKLICASNENNVLYDFLRTGIYDIRRELKLTNSPSMDIIISSNLERLLYHLSNEDTNTIKMLMNKLSSVGVYEVSDEIKEALDEFYGGYASEKETASAIAELYENTGYVMDTHTAVAYSVYKKFKEETGNDKLNIIASTASPFKFGRSVCAALKIAVENLNDFEVLDKLSRNTGFQIPEPIKALKNKDIIHRTVCNKEDMKKTIENFLNVQVGK